MRKITTGRPDGRQAEFRVPDFRTGIGDFIAWWNARTHAADRRG